MGSVRTLRRWMVETAEQAYNSLHNDFSLWEVRMADPVTLDNENIERAAELFGLKRPLNIVPVDWYYYGDWSGTLAGYQCLDNGGVASPPDIHTITFRENLHPTTAS